MCNLFFSIGLFSLFIGFSLNVHAASIKISLKDKKAYETDFSEYVLWVDEVNEKAKMRAKKQKTYNMDMVNLKFSPKVLAIRTGDSVRFDNLETIFHNVFSLDKKNKFDLGLYKGTAAFKENKKKKIANKQPVQQFHHPGVVNVFCNIHSKMHGRVFVFDHPYYAVSNKDGVFRLELPKGQKKIKIIVEGPKLKRPFHTELDGENLEKSIGFAPEFKKYRSSTFHTNKLGKDYKEHKY